MHGGAAAPGGPEFGLLCLDFCVISPSLWKFAELDTLSVNVCEWCPNNTMEFLQHFQ